MTSKMGKLIWIRQSTFFNHMDSSLDEFSCIPLLMNFHVLSPIRSVALSFATISRTCEAVTREEPWALPILASGLAHPSLRELPWHSLAEYLTVLTTWVKK
jgi:hypothetical protein